MLLAGVGVLVGVFVAAAPIEASPDFSAALKTTDTKVSKNDMPIVAEAVRGNRIRTMDKATKTIKRDATWDLGDFARACFDIVI
jgi:hypothetical protein